ncbi:MAG: DUF1161 domain-containing protein [Candidatus Electrothrix sp. AR5]|nr:DUF1161 domain-containing protein [Candidatus Electrothrix sp. AR5]
MKWFIVFALVLFNFSQAYGAIKPCVTLKAEIAAKLETAGVKSYGLTVVKNEEVESSTTVKGKIVGSCEAGAKKIIYTKNQGLAKPNATD